MASYRLNNLAITVEKEGAGQFTKASYPIRFGRHSEIRTAEFEFQFNVNGEIKFIRGLDANWPHPSEFLKRTDGNDWIFYTVGSVSGHGGILDWLGEYYLPCLPYPSNSLVEFNPYSDLNILRAFSAWSQLYGNLFEMRHNGRTADCRDFIDRILSSDDGMLHARAEKLHSIIGGPVSVLPPDTRHVDYEVIPLNIADGCLYHCDFCTVQSPQRFQPRSRESIRAQVRDLKAFYDRNAINYKALFFGNHDALGAGDEPICMAADEALKAFGHENRYFANPLLFLFGSVDSLLKAGDGLLNHLNQLPFYTYLNIGLESVDADTLAAIHKPLAVAKIRDAFRKMLEVNENYANIEVTANFLLGAQLSPEHNASLADLLHSVPEQITRKGAIYLSPLMNSPQRSALLQTFFEIRKLSRLPAFIYLIQRL